MKYKLWKVLTENSNYFDSFSDHTIEKKEKKKEIFKKIGNIVFFKCSDILSFFFSRLCSKNNINEEKKPLLSQPVEKKKNKYQSDISVEYFIDSIIQKMNLTDKELQSMNIKRILAMLKGNWFTTIADLRNLTEEDAEKLTIPINLFNAIQDELPKEGKNYLKILSFEKNYRK